MPKAKCRQEKPSSRDSPIMYGGSLILTNTKKHGNSKPIPVLFGAGGGIRTPVGFHPNGFQDRLVMTASIRLHVYLIFILR